MKKIFFIIITFIIFMSPAKAAWDSNITSDGSQIDGNGGCYVKSIGSCYVHCNSEWYLAILAKLVYYDGSSYRELGSAIVGKYANGIVANTKLAQTIPGIKLFNGLPVPQADSGPGLGYNNTKSYNYSTIIKNAVIGHTSELISLMGLNYNDVMNDIKNGRYPKHKKANGSIYTTGVRLTVEPVFTIATTGACPSVGSDRNYYGTAKAIAELAAQNTNQSHPNFWPKNLSEFSNRLKLERNDIGYNAFTSNELANWKSQYSGYGIGIFSPFDDVEAKPAQCNPGTSATTIKKCCTEHGITEGNTSKNTTEFLTRKLTDLEILDHCTATPTKCNPGDTDSGVKNCCRKLDITNTNQTRNTTRYLTRKLSDAEINLLCTPESVAAVPNCTYILKDTSVDNCNKDSDDYGIPQNVFSSKYNSWQCIFRSPESQYNEVRNFFDGMGSDKNDYCHIYCHDEIVYKFPKSDIETFSGRFLTVGYSAIYPAIYPVNYTYERVCRTTDKKNSEKGLINYDQFELDMERNERKIVEAWDSYKAWKGKQEACKNAVQIKSEQRPKCLKQYNGKCVYSQTYTYYDYYGTADYKGQTYTCEFTLSNGDTNYESRPDYLYQANNSYNTYQHYLDLRDEYLGQIDKCNSLNTSTYFSPEVDFTYEEPVYGTTIELRSKSSTDTVNNYFNGGNAKMTDSEADAYQTPQSSYRQYQVSYCNDSGCNNKRTIFYKANAWTESISKKTVDFTLPKNLNLYINKYSGQSFSTPAEAGLNYIKMSETNLPIHYSTKPGSYGFNIKTTSFGYFNGLEQFALKGASFAGKTYDFKESYDCNYRVSCEKVVIKDQSDCDYYKTACPGEYEKFGCGSGFIFRPISTESKEAAFPGSDGTGRTPGGIWNNTGTIEARITNARGVEGEEIYRLSPMYEITLTPKLITEIKKYNDKMEKEKVTIYQDSQPTTGIAGYTSMDGFECKYNGNHCISEKIRDWGVKGCALTGLDTGYLKCDGVDKW